MFDVSITDLIAEAQERFALSPECYSDQHIEVRLTKALKNAQTTLEADEEYINKIESKVAVLESVTVPTERECCACTHTSNQHEPDGTGGDYCAFSYCECTGFRRPITASTKPCEAKSEDAYGTPRRCIFDDETHDYPHAWQRISVTAPTDKGRGALDAADRLELALDPHKREGWTRLQDAGEPSEIDDLRTVIRAFRTTVPVDRSSGVSS